jgi:hypothetical protein
MFRYDPIFPTTLVAAGVLSLGLALPETGLYAATAAYNGAIAFYNGVEYSTAVVAGTGMVASQAVLANPQVIVSTSQFVQGYFTPYGPYTSPSQALGQITRDLQIYYQSPGH